MTKEITLHEYDEMNKEVLIKKKGHIFKIDTDFQNLKEDEKNKLEKDKTGFYLFATDKEKIDLSTDEIVNILETHEYAYEDYIVSDEATEFIEAFVEKFNNKHAKHSYFINTNVKVRIDVK